MHEGTNSYCTTYWPLADSTSKNFLYTDYKIVAYSGWLSWLAACVASLYIMIITRIHCFHDSVCKGGIHHELLKAPRCSICPRIVVGLPFMSWLPVALQELSMFLQFKTVCVQIMPCRPAKK